MAIPEGGDRLDREREFAQLRQHLMEAEQIVARLETAFVNEQKRRPTDHEGGERLSYGAAYRSLGGSGYGTKSVANPSASDSRPVQESWMVGGGSLEAPSIGGSLGGSRLSEGTLTNSRRDQYTELHGNTASAEFSRTASVTARQSEHSIYARP
jgi:hypothetical protein